MPCFFFDLIRLHNNCPSIPGLVFYIKNAQKAKKTKKKEVIFMKKVLSLVLAAIMLLSMVPTAFAAETADYTNGTTVVYTAAASEAYTITVPAQLAPGGSGTVTLSGTWPSNTTVTVTADENVVLTNSISGANTKVLDVTFAGISEAGSNTEKQTFTETVSVEAITNALFGTWDGHFYYNVDWTKEIEVEGLGSITVQNPNGAEFTYDSTTGILMGTTPITPVDPEDLENLIPMIEFTAGTFESNTEYTPGQYELETYEVTRTRTKKPVACNGGIILSCTYVGDGTFQDNLPTPGYIDHASTYMAYCVARTGDTTVNGFVPYHLNYRTIANTADDTLENAIYIAAYAQKGTNINWNVAKWDGSKYVDVNCRAEIDAITDFTETYTETLSRPVTITKPSSSTTLVYLPGGTMKAEEGMTWAEWLTSDYNTFGADTTTVWDSDYNEVALDTEIVAGGSYGFVVVEGEPPESTKLEFPFEWNTADVSGNTTVESLVKISNLIPSIDDVIYTFCVNEITRFEVVAFNEVIDLGNGNFMFSYHAENRLYSADFGFVAVATAGDINGIYFPEPGLYTQNYFVNDGTETNIKIISSIGREFAEKNEYGFYYGVRYSAELDGETVALMLYEDGSAYIVGSGGAEVLASAGEANYSPYSIELPGGGLCTISSDGKSITYADAGVTFTYG